MNRSVYFNEIEEKLNILATRIESRARLNILDLNIHSETFYPTLINQIFDWELENINLIEQQNIAAIDLIDKSRSIIVQVSSTATKQKIESSLTKEILKDYPGFTFKFISIAKDVDSLKKNTYKNPYNCLFKPAKDILDKNSILKKILGMEIDCQKRMHDFLRKELRVDDFHINLESSIAELINVLANEEFQEGPSNIPLNSFKIEEKINFNNISNFRSIIDDCSIYSHQVEKKYEIFDQEGKNKSISVLRTISRLYLEEKVKTNNSDKILLNTINQVAQFAKNSVNFNPINQELLLMTAEIVTVDAFLRCRIFENPNAY